MASILAGSLKRLYEGGRLTKEQIGERVEKGSITPEDYAYVTGEAYAAEPEPEEKDAGKGQGQEEAPAE